MICINYRQLLFNNTDVTKLLKDITVLRVEMEYIKEKYATVEQLQSMKKELQPEQVPSSLRIRNINMKRGGGYMQDSGPIGLSTVDVADNSMDKNMEHSAIVGEYRSLAHSQAQIIKPTPCVNSTLLESDLNTEKSALICDASENNDKPLKQLTLAEVVRKGEWKKSEPSNEWKLVENKKRARFTGKKGVAMSNLSDKFRAADIKIPLFISYVNKEALEEDICNYIKSKTSETVSLEKIKMKKERSYNAFKCYVSKNKLDTFLDDHLWPDGIIFRRFIRRGYDVNNESSLANTNGPQQDGEQIINN